jgi:hypothetical protein
MPSSTSTKNRDAHQRGAQGGGGKDDGGDEGGGGGGGGGGKLIKVGFARNQAEGEMLQGLLLDSDIPSILKRSAGFDNPDFLAGGPHDIWVNAQHAREARELLEETMTESPGEEEAEVLGRAGLEASGGDPMTPERLAIWLLAAVAAAALIVWVLWEVT